jgi:hypothetical protein
MPRFTDEYYREAESLPQIIHVVQRKCPASALSAYVQTHSTINKPTG